MPKRFVSAAVSLLAAIGLLLPTGAAWALAEVSIYNSIPTPLPPNVTSLGYQATQTLEFGDYIQFAGSGRALTSVTVTMSDWALHSDYPAMPAAGFYHPITLNIYNAVMSGGIPSVGSLIATKTQAFLIPWRPEADPTCPGGTAWRADNGQCYNGLAFNITFDLTSLNIMLPEAVIYGIAYNTNTWGYAPLGVPGPYESLNVGLNTTSGPSVGTDGEPDAVFWNTMTAGWYTDGGAGGVGIFRRDTNWSGFVPAVRFNTLADVSGCKNGGWKTYLAPEHTFKNQGDCIQYVNTGK
jgi:hypothetical protein